MTEPLHVTVVIPTFKRPDGLKRTIESVQAQVGLENHTVDLLIVDNDPAGSAEPVVSSLSETTFPVRYVHEPNPGVANARNTAVDHLQAPLMAFIDDDQTAPATWLANLLKAYQSTPAVVTFGPVITVLPDNQLTHEEYLKGFFERTGPEKSGWIDAFYGCGNSLFDMHQLADRRPLFDVAANEIGGEDDFLFSKLEAEGHQFGWAADAPANEHVPAHRATLKYALKRAFAYGQAPCTIASKKSPPDIPAIFFWTIVGMGQAVVYGLIAAGLWLVRHKRRAFWLDKAAQGLGKPFWFGPFELKFYGVSAPRSTSQSGACGQTPDRGDARTGNAIERAI